MRGNEFSAVLGPEPWLKGGVFLPPSSILRAYQLESTSEEGKSTHSVFSRLRDSPDDDEAKDDVFASSQSLVSHKGLWAQSIQSISSSVRRPPPPTPTPAIVPDDLFARITYDTPLASQYFSGALPFDKAHAAMASSKKSNHAGSDTSIVMTTTTELRSDTKIVPLVRSINGDGQLTVDCPASIFDYLKRIKGIRQLCDANDLIPVYHYTAPYVASLIAESK
jgi:hypothetical protein